MTRPDVVTPAMQAKRAQERARQRQADEDYQLRAWRRNWRRWSNGPVRTERGDLRRAARAAFAEAYPGRRITGRQLVRFRKAVNRGQCAPGLED